MRISVGRWSLIRDSGITNAQVRALAELPPAARQAVVDLISHTASTQPPAPGAG